MSRHGLHAGSGRAIYLVFGAIFLIVGLGLLFGGVQDASRERAYARDGRLVDAVVVDKSIRRASREGGRGSTRYEVAYRFTAPDGHTVNGVDAVDVDDWERLAPGSVFQVTYLSEAPQANRAAGSGDTVTPWLMMGLGSVFALIGGGIAAATVAGMLRASRTT
jgi:hypothetical protein